jgi:hypothetical protein
MDAIDKRVRELYAKNKDCEANIGFYIAERLRKNQTTHDKMIDSSVLYWSKQIETNLEIIKELVNVGNAIREESR